MRKIENCEWRRSREVEGVKGKLWKGVFLGK